MRIHPPVGFLLPKRVREKEKTNRRYDALAFQLPLFPASPPPPLSFLLPRLRLTRFRVLVSV